MVGDLINGPTVNAREMYFCITGSVESFVAQDEVVPSDVGRVQPQSYFVGDYFSEVTVGV